MEGIFLLFYYCRNKDTGLERDLLSSIPMWVRFPALDLKFMSRAVISKVASLVGKPLFMDKATSWRGCLLQGVSLKSRHPPAGVKLEVPGRGIVDQPVEYEWLPSITGFPA